ncbi:MULTISPECIES: hypothetical protein [Streptomyces]|uniref:hypothetical protein n=1 Tax=Streptomyces TaxID=1883 RepID=UPI001F1D05AB|nr:hypothetical protein [Streptomyces noursei]MCE4941635.1 hypothetical protein [Streptomyces noursei]
MSERPAPARREAADQDPERHGERLRELDRDIIRLIQLRVREDRLLQGARRTAGLPRTDLARENAVLRGYREALGPAGAQLALLLIGMTRRPDQTAGGREERTSHEP